MNKAILLSLALGVAMLNPVQARVSKKELKAQAEQMQLELEKMREAEQKKKNQNPTRISRELDPCETLALESSDNFRAAGTATAKNESEAKSAALTDARNQLAQMVRVVVNGVSQDYNKNTVNQKQVNSLSIGEELMNQYVYQSLESTVPIKWSIYDLSNGLVQVYVCVEMTKNPEDFKQEFNNRLAQGINSPSSIQPQSLKTNPQAEEIFEQGRDFCIKNNFGKGMPLLIKAIEMGSFNAQHYVGVMYLNGSHVEQNSKTAFKYILSAANGGHKEAVFQIAEMYNSGTGTNKNKVEAKFWYEKAKELGDTRAESRLRRL